VGTTAVRKSSKIKDITEEFNKRIPRITDKDDLVNFTYYLARLYDFDIVSRVSNDLRSQLISKGISSTVKYADQGMEFENVLRHFGDLS
jgi:hypothetical protein